LNLEGLRRQQFCVPLTITPFIITAMLIYIKNMVCVRCKMAVQVVLEQLQIEYLNIQLGKVKLAGTLSPEQLKKLSVGLSHYQLELLDNRKMIIVSQVKTVIIELFELPEKDMLWKLSDYLSSQLQYDYTYLANIFSEMEATTIEHFYIAYRIEKAKELMLYEGMTIKEISYKLNFSSVSHLSQQFKK
jgi:AraC family transcriptional regulator